MSRLLLILLLALLGSAPTPPLVGETASDSTHTLRPTPYDLPSWDDLGMGFLLPTGNEAGSYTPTSPASPRTTSHSHTPLLDGQSSSWRLYRSAHRMVLPHRPCRGYLHHIACLRL